MSWGNLAGSVGENLGMGPLPRVAGDVRDMVTATQQKNQLGLEQDKFLTQELKLATQQTNQWLAERGDQLALRDKLLGLAEKIKEATGNTYLAQGIPYAPSSAQIHKETAELSDHYQRDVLKLAQLNASRKKAKHYSSLGGAESPTMLAGLARENVDTYSEQLWKARQRAKTDAIANATARMKLDQEVRGVMQ